VITALGETGSRHPDLEAAIEELALVDHHVHGAAGRDLDRAAFERVITESDRPAAPGTTTFDSQVGFALLRWCAPVLGLEAHTPPEQYVARRLELGGAEVNRRLLRASGVGQYLVDTGFASGEVLGVEAMAAASGGRAAEIVRLESVAEEIAAEGGTAAGFDPAVRARVAARIEAGAVGTKSVAAYRHGLDLAPGRPDARAVTEAAGRWLREVDGGGAVRVGDPTLLASLWWTGIDAWLPLQLHTGFGDTDLHLLRSNPLHLTEFIKRAEPSGTPIVLLHCYPYHREAGYLAQMFPCVYFDVGEAINYVGAAARRIVAESLELAPFSKQLFSSDAWGPAELHLLGARLWRRAMGAVLGDWVAAGDWTLAQAQRVATMIGVDNATRLYRLT
jgi:hypothetical protein